MFRRTTHSDDNHSREWEDWFAANRGRLASIGLPPEVYQAESSWLDFLENGHLHWHPSSGFDFLKLAEKQQEALLRFLEDEYADVVPAPNLVRWLRGRLQRAPE